MAENSPASTPLTLIGNDAQLAEVYDPDEGTNGTFNLFLQGDDGTFEVTPTSAINEAAFVLRVRNPSRLDYEADATGRTFNFSLVAEETGPARRRSTLPVMVLVRDRNDNLPQFAGEKVNVEVAEDLRPGGRVARLTATDADSGLFGTDGIKYTDITGTIRNNVTLCLTIITQQSFDRFLISNLH